MVDKNWVKVMPEFCSTGLWDKNGTNMETDEVPISQSVIERLENWNAWYNRECDCYLPDGGKGEFNYVEFALEGERIAKAIKLELPEWTVMYWNENLFHCEPRNGNNYETEITLAVAQNV